MNGKFRISADELPVTIIISFLGYVSQERIVDSEKELNIKLATDKVLLKDVEVVGSRISEKERQAPLTIESMDVIAITGGSGGGLATATRPRAQPADIVE